MTPGPASVEKLAASAAVEPREVAPRRPPIHDRFQRSYAASIHSVRGGSCCLPPPPPSHHPPRTTLPAAYLWRAARRHLALVSGEARFGRSAVQIGRRWQSRSKTPWHWTLPKRLTMADPAESLQQLMDTTPMPALQSSSWSGKALLTAEACSKLFRYFEASCFLCCFIVLQRNACRASSRSKPAGELRVRACLCLWARCPERIAPCRP